VNWLSKLYFIHPIIFDLSTTCTSGEAAEVGVTVFLWLRTRFYQLVLNNHYRKHLHVHIMYYMLCHVGQTITVLFIWYRSPSVYSSERSVSYDRSVITVLLSAVDKYSLEADCQWLKWLKFNPYTVKSLNGICKCIVKIHPTDWE